MMMYCTPHHIHDVIDNIEWETLLFFACLFVLIEGLAKMQLIALIGEMLTDLVMTIESPQTQLFAAVELVLFVSAIASAFVDNIPYTTTIVPVIQHLAEDTGLPIEPLVWALAFGACFGGNGTLVGASANLVTADISGAVGHKISFAMWFRVGFPAMLISVTAANIYLLLVFIVGVPGWLLMILTLVMLGVRIIIGIKLDERREAAEVIALLTGDDLNLHERKPSPDLFHLQKLNAAGETTPRAVTQAEPNGGQPLHAAENPLSTVAATQRPTDIEPAAEAVGSPPPGGALEAATDSTASDAAGITRDSSPAAEGQVRSRRSSIANQGRRKRRQSILSSTAIDLDVDDEGRSRSLPSRSPTASQSPSSLPANPKSLAKDSNDGSVTDQTLDTEQPAELRMADAIRRVALDGDGVTSTTLSPATFDTDGEQRDELPPMQNKLPPLHMDQLSLASTAGDSPVAGASPLGVSRRRAPRRAPRRPSLLHAVSEVLAEDDVEDIEL